MHHMHDVFAQTTSIIGHEEEEVTIDPTKWGAWAHRGHRLWASMSEDFWIHVYKVRVPRASATRTSCHAHKAKRRARDRGASAAPCRARTTARARRRRAPCPAAPTASVAATPMVSSSYGCTRPASARACAPPARGALAGSASLPTPPPSLGTIPTPLRQPSSHRCQCRCRCRYRCGLLMLIIIPGFLLCVISLI